ncbi:uncharacterized protein LOC113464391 isoform X2 [Ceratina calcarata]|uniref:Uncharacterized protein LOC113464391 isoform X2 n=1 Tax=Ceratina calcarata TaxID=156304 RepID=A0AAJ7S2Y6_9HYME|nr:uncharacterized protein LOC113464391 isoform X2 [Ceratina calcarata]
MRAERFASHTEDIRTSGIRKLLPNNKNKWSKQSRGRTWSSPAKCFRENAKYSSGCCWQGFTKRLAGGKDRQDDPLTVTHLPRSRCTCGWGMEYEKWKLPKLNCRSNCRT